MQKLRSTTHLLSRSTKREYKYSDARLKLKSNTKTARQVKRTWVASNAKIKMFYRNKKAHEMVVKTAKFLCPSKIVILSRRLTTPFIWTLSITAQKMKKMKFHSCCWTSGVRVWSSWIHLSISGCNFSKCTVTCCTLKSNTTRRWRALQKVCLWRSLRYQRVRQARRKEKCSESKKWMKTAKSFTLLRNVLISTSMTLN